MTVAAGSAQARQPAITKDCQRQLLGFQAIDTALRGGGP